MLKTIIGISEKEYIRPLEKINIPKGTKVLITVLEDQKEDDNKFFLQASNPFNFPQSKKLTGISNLLF